MKATSKTPAVGDCPRLEVSADGRGMTGRASLGLLARMANRIGGDQSPVRGGGWMPVVERP